MSLNVHHHDNRWRRKNDSFIRGDRWRRQETVGGGRRREAKTGGGLGELAL